MTPISATSSARGSDKSRFLVLSILFASILAPAVARADDDACSGPATKHAYAPSGDTLLSLAICHEAHGKTASAWAEYQEAASLAKRTKRPALAKVALGHASSVERRLSKLVIRVAPEWDMPSLEVLRDGVGLDRAAWGSALPVDPGEHVVEATADGKTFRRTVLVRREGETQVVTVAGLAYVPDAALVSTTTLTSATVSTSQPAEAPSNGTAQRVIGLVVAGAGLATIGAGAYLGVEALDRRDVARAACPSSPCSDRAGVEENGRAKEAATLSTLTLAAGGAAVVLGAIVFFTAPSRTPRVGLAAAPGYAGLGLTGDLP